MPGSPAVGHASDGVLPSAILTNRITSAIVTVPSPSQSPRHRGGASSPRAENAPAAMRRTVAAYVAHQRPRNGNRPQHRDGVCGARVRFAYGGWCITYAVHLGVWAAAEDVALGALDEGAVRAFLAHLARCRCPGHRAGLHGVARARTAVFVRYLRARGIVPVPAPPAAPPTLVLIESSSIHYTIVRATHDQMCCVGAALSRDQHGDGSAA
jgi:hypothetical protein